MSKSNTDTTAIVFDPALSGRLAVDYVDDMRKHKDAGVKSGITDLDKILVPLRPGWLVTVIGYTSHLKSTWMDWLGLRALETIKPEENGFIAKVTWEQSVEEDTLSWMASRSGLSLTRLARGLVTDDEWVKLEGVSVQRATTPLWVLGHSQQEFKRSRQARPRMTMRDVARGIEYIIHESVPDQTLSPKMVILDYLQRMRHDPQDGDTRREQMMESVNLSKDLAVAYGCPVILGVQAKREAANRMPTLDDGQETSNVEQSSDVSFGCWYPVKGQKPGSDVDGFKVNKNLFFLRLLKQKLGEAPATFPLYVDPERRTFASMAKI